RCTTRLALTLRRRASGGALSTTGIRRRASARSPGPTPELSLQTTARAPARCASRPRRSARESPPSRRRGSEPGWPRTSTQGPLTAEDRTTASALSYSAAVQYTCRFTCITGHEGSWEVTEPIYRCPKCGGLLEVTHDVDALRDRSGAAWMKLFEQRYKGTAWP